MVSTIEGIKKKMIATKEKTEEAREREIDAKSELKILKETISSKEDEAASYKRRIQFLRSKVKEATAEIDEKEKRLNELTEKAETEADKGRELTYAEVETDEQLRSIEVQVQNAQSAAENSLMKLNDAQRKLTVLENDLHRSEERRDRASKRIPELEQMIRTAGENLRKLEQDDVLAMERENDNEQKIKILEEELKKKIEECEETERLEQNSLRRVDEIVAEIEFEREKKQKLENEFAEIEQLEWEAFDILSVLFAAKIFEPHALKSFTEKDIVDFSGS